MRINLMFVFFPFLPLQVPVHEFIIIIPFGWTMRRIINSINRVTRAQNASTKNREWFFSLLLLLASSSSTVRYPFLFCRLFRTCSFTRPLLWKVNDTHFQKCCAAQQTIHSILLWLLLLCNSFIPSFFELMCAIVGRLPHMAYNRRATALAPPFFLCPTCPQHLVTSEKFGKWQRNDAMHSHRFGNAFGSELHLGWQRFRLRQ